jgi:heat shock protein HslJ
VSIRARSEGSAVKGSWATLVASLIAMGCASGGADEKARAPGGDTRPAAISPLAASLAGTSWSAESIDGGGVVDGVRSTLAFERDGRVSGSGGCNRYFGTAAFSADRLELRPLGTTRMACPPAVMDQETRFLAAVAATVKVREEGGQLLLVDQAGTTRARLAPLPPGVKP